MIGSPRMLVQALRIGAANPTAEQLRIDLMEEAATTIEDLIQEVDDLKMELKEDRD